MSAPAPAAPAPERAWFEGSWQGAFEAQLFRVEVPVGGVKEWKTDDGKRASGAATLKLAIGADGVVSGSASGALGELLVSGRAEAERVALSLRAVEPDGFHGFMLASQTPEGMRGTLNASSADSLSVRRAEVALSRAKP
jgi:hypothetical protein